MRILVLSNMYPPHHLGGYEQSCRDCVDRWRSSGHDVTILTTDHRVAGVQDAPGERDRGIRRDLSFYLRDHLIVSPSLRERLRIERHNQRVLEDALTVARPDVVSVWHMGAMSLGLLTTIAERQIPMVLVICDDWLLYAPDADAWLRPLRRRPRIGEVIGRLTSLPTRLPRLDATAFCFISDWVARRAEQRSPWAMPIRSVVYNGIDTRDFPIDPRDERPWAWRLLYAGRVEQRKGIHVAVESLVHLPPSATLLVDGRGDDAYRERLMRLAAGLGVAGRVRFADTPRSQLRDRYKHADVVLFPVLWDEPLGLVPVEAMACGTPVVATATGGSAEFLLGDVNCVRVPTGDAPALAAAVRRLADDPSLRTRLRHGGTRTAAELTIDRYAEVLDEWNRSASRGFTDRPPDRPRITEIVARGQDDLVPPDPSGRQPT